jgi:hypothetical protein
MLIKPALPENSNIYFPSFNPLSPMTLMLLLESSAKERTSSLSTKCTFKRKPIHLNPKLMRKLPQLPKRMPLQLMSLLQLMRPPQLMRLLQLMKPLNQLRPQLMMLRKER